VARLSSIKNFPPSPLPAGAQILPRATPVAANVVVAVAGIATATENCRARHQRKSPALHLRRSDCLNLLPAGLAILQHVTAV